MNGIETSREKTIVKTSVIGIVANVFLAGFKAVIGLMSNSIAIVLDAVNNISDAGSSLITIVGTKLAGREPDKKHPFGYGRIEYRRTITPFPSSSWPSRSWSRSCSGATSRVSA